MRFLGYTLGDESTMPAEPPSPEVYKEMDAFVEEAVKAGVIVATITVGFKILANSASTKFSTIGGSL